MIQTRLAAILDILVVDNCRSLNLLIEAMTSTTIPFAQTQMVRGPVLAILALVGNEIMSMSVLCIQR